MVAARRGPVRPPATGTWMNEFGAWYFDLARRWDGSFAHQGPPEMNGDSYQGWDATGGYLLAYAMPLKKIYLTGKRPGIAPQLDAVAARALILDGRGWSNKDRDSAYDKFGDDQLLECLASWSPVVRERAAMALARRKERAGFRPAENARVPAHRQPATALAKPSRCSRAPPPPLCRRCAKPSATRTSGCASRPPRPLQPSAGPPCSAVPELLEMLARVDPRTIRAACSSGIFLLSAADPDAHGRHTQKLRGV